MQLKGSKDAYPLAHIFQHRTLQISSFCEVINFSLLEMELIPMNILTYAFGFLGYTE